MPYLRPRSVLALVVVALSAAACSGDDDTAPVIDPAPTTTRPTTTTTTLPPTTTSTTSSTSSTSTSTTTTTLPPIPRQPLTGVPLEDGAEPADRPALAVKIDNAPGARRNHSGLAVADLVYEEIVEGSITRFAAVFHSQGSDPVGPIRSGRSQDVDLLTSLRRPLFAWSGGNPGVEALIGASTFVDLSYTGSGRGYYRGPGSVPHNLYSDTDTLWSQTPDDHPGAPPQQFEYVRPGDEFGGEPTAGLELAMRGIDVEWTWDAETNRFLRSQEGGAHVDRVHGRIGATNVVVLVVEYRPSQIDARSPEAQTLGEGGPAWVFSDGRVERGTWIRVSRDDGFTLVDADGEPILLRPGNTWVELAEAIPTDDPAEPDVDLLVIPPAG